MSVRRVTKDKAKIPPYLTPSSTIFARDAEAFPSSIQSGCTQSADGISPNSTRECVALVIALAVKSVKMRRVLARDARLKVHRELLVVQEHVRVVESRIEALLDLLDAIDDAFEIGVACKDDEGRVGKP